ncbi:hypothetical protein [Nocardia sp.]|uniref:hypothetical protein n=1 Tax=Nocardia sp. TaxID=1821 RepID=UPI0026376958|nr:hypothetical protein [Nocardia sp.]
MKVVFVRAFGRTVGRTPIQVRVATLEDTPFDPAFQNVQFFGAVELTVFEVLFEVEQFTFVALATVVTGHFQLVDFGVLLPPQLGVVGAAVELDL